MNPNYAYETNFRGLKIRFMVFFCLPAVLIYTMLGKPIINSLSHIFNMGLNMRSWVFIVVSILFCWLFWRVYTIIFDRLAAYPFNPENDAGHLKNTLYLMIMILFDFVIFFGMLFFLFGQS
jgi:hypothetical protein